MSKKVWKWSVLLCLFVGLVFATSAQARKITLRVIAPDWAPYHKIVEHLNPDYERLNPDVKVEYDIVGFVALYEKQMTQLVTQSDIYDIYITDIVWFGQYSEAGWIENLTPYLKDPKLTPAGFNYFDFEPAIAVGLGIWDREIYGIDPVEAMRVAWEKNYIYGIPSNSDVGFLTYRKDLFDHPEEKASFLVEYGYELTPPRNYKEYLDIAKFFTRKTGEKLAGKTLTEDFYGTTIIGIKADYVTQAYLTMLYTFDGKFFDENWRPVFNSPEGLAALETYVKMAQFAPPGPAEQGYSENIATMCAGKAAIQFQDINCIAGISRDPVQSKVSGKVASITMSAGPGGNWVPQCGGFGLAINKASNYKKEAWDYLSWVKNPENDLKLELLFPSATRTSTLRHPDRYKTWDFADVVSKSVASEIPDFRPRVAEYPELTEILMVELSAAVSGVKTPKNALDTAAEKIEALMKSRGYIK